MNITIKKFEEKPSVSSRSQRFASSSGKAGQTARERTDLFEKLRLLRLQIAKEEAVPPYIVFTDKTLVDMCDKLPKTEAEMLDVSGVGQNKLKKYGKRFLEEIASFQEQSSFS